MARLCSAKNKTTFSSKIDWQVRDENFAKKIPAIVEAIRSEPGRPVQVTKTEIGRRMGAKPWFFNQIHKTPMTKAVLNELIEPGEAFAIRRLLWARDYFIQQNKIPCQSTFMDKAGVAEQFHLWLNILIITLLAEIQKALG